VAEFGFGFGGGECAGGNKEGGKQSGGTGPAVEAVYLPSPWFSSPRAYQVLRVSR